MNQNFYDLDPVVLLKKIVLFIENSIFGSVIRSLTSQNCVYHKTCDIKISKRMRQPTFFFLICDVLLT